MSNHQWLPLPGKTPREAVVARKGMGAESANQFRSVGRQIASRIQPRIFDEPVQSGFWLSRFSSLETARLCLASTAGLFVHPFGFQFTSPELCVLQAAP